MSKYGGLWKRICKFLGFKSVSDGYTKENTEGKETPQANNYDVQLFLKEELLYLRVATVMVSLICISQIVELAIVWIPRIKYFFAV